MPKATTIRKSRNFENGNIRSDVSESVELFDSGVHCPVDGDHIDTSRGEQKDGQQKGEEEREGSLGLQEDIRLDSKHPEENRGRDKGQRVLPEEDGVPRAEQDCTDDGKERAREGTPKASGRGNRKVRKGKEADGGTRNGIEEGERHPEEKRGAGKERKDQQGSRREFERREFEESCTVMVHKPVVHGPYQTDNPYVVDVVLDDGYMYRVSSCSIREGKYIQGLDSMFIVRRLKSVK